jgi:hypothetical protein
MQNATGSDEVAAIMRRRRRGGGSVTPPLNAITTELTNLPPLGDVEAENGLPLYTDP